MGIWAQILPVELPLSGWPNGMVSKGFTHHLSAVLAWPLGTWYPRSFQRYPRDLAKCNPSLSATQSDSWDARLDTSSKTPAPFRGERKTKSQRKDCQDHQDQDMHTSHIWHIVSYSLEKSNSTRCIITIGYSFIDYQSTSRSAGD
jgi:hypothetical protein